MVALTLRGRALRWLARREHARAELEQKLVATGASRDEVGVVLDEMHTLGFLSDQRYARGFARSRSTGYGKRAIVHELKRKGVAVAEIDSALEDAGIDDERTLGALWERRFGTPPANDREKARQIRFFEARGFRLSTILKLLREVSAVGRNT